MAASLALSYTKPARRSVSVTGTSRSLSRDACCTPSCDSRASKSAVRSLADRPSSCFPRLEQPAGRPGLCPPIPAIMLTHIGAAGPDNDGATYSARMRATPHLEQFRAIPAGLSVSNAVGLAHRVDGRVEAEGFGHTLASGNSRTRRPAFVCFVRPSYGFPGPENRCACFIA